MAFLLSIFRKKEKKKEDLISSFFIGGRNRTRTCDPIDVNDVLYQLSHATLPNFAVIFLFKMTNLWSLTVG